MPPKMAQNGPKMAQKVPQKSCRSSRIQNPFFESELQTYRNGMCPVLSIHMLPTPGQQHFQENHHLKDHSSCIESLLIRFKPFQTHAILLTRLAGQISNVNFQVSSFSRESITNRITIWHGIKFSHGKKISPGKSTEVYRPMDLINRPKNVSTPLGSRSRRFEHDGCFGPQ